MSGEITVFVSHSHRDIEIAEKMCEYLHQKGLTCWISSRSIPGGKWPEYVMHGINNCDVFVLIYSRHSNESGNVENEVINAAKTDALLIPFCLDSSEMNATLTLHLAKYEKVMVGNAPLEQKFDELYQKITIAMDNGNFSLNRPDKPENSQSSIVRNADVNYSHNSNNKASGSRDGKKKSRIFAISIVVFVLAMIFFAFLAGRNSNHSVAESTDLSESVETEKVIDSSEEEEAVSTEEALSSNEEVSASSGYTAMIYASAVVEFTPGDPWTSEADAQDPEDILGAPDRIGDSNALTLGGGGEIILQFSEEFTDLEGDDIVIYEVGDSEESLQVLVSADCNTWYTVGKTTGGTEGMDINGYVPEGMYFKYIKLIDQKSQASGTWPGADVDAVGVYIEI